MAMTIREDIAKLQKSVGDLDKLISDDGETKTLFGMIVTIDESTGAVSLTEPDDND